MSTAQSYTHFARQLFRTGFYYGLRQITERRVARLTPQAAQVDISKPVPSARTLLRDVASFLKSDADLVRDGILPSIMNDADSLGAQFQRIQDMIDDLPVAHERRTERNGKEIAEELSKDTYQSELPDYFVQNFHYQTGGYLTDESARLYDVQVETLFMGTSGAMRRQALRPVANYIKGRNQRQLKLLDVACGTGRFISQIRQAFPCLPITGIDLSAAYIREAERYLADWRSIELLVGNAEKLPAAENSYDVVSCIYLFHELPPEVRRTVAAELARVLKPGGLFVFVDSLQYGDNPSYDGLLEAFPQRFHEPYYRNYLVDDLNAVFEAQGLQIDKTYNALLSKVITCKK